MAKRPKSVAASHLNQKWQEAAFSPEQEEKEVHDLPLLMPEAVEMRPKSLHLRPYKKRIHR